jgi:tetraacyldisaccharide 4'-kinase
MARRGWRAPVPVISVDSVTGAPVLPAALAVIGHLQGRGLSPAVLMGAGARAPVRVDMQAHGSGEVPAGAILVAAMAPTWIAGDLVAGVREACCVERARGVTPECVVLLGQAYEPSLEKDLSIIVIDAARGFGNGLCRPAGPLPEPLAQALRRAQLGLAIGPPAQQARFASEWGRAIPWPCLKGRWEALPTGMDWQGLRTLVFSGSREAAHVFATLRALGALPVREVTLADEAPPGPALLERLRREAAGLGAQLVTTEVDALRLPGAFRREVLVLPMRLRLEEWSALDAALDLLLPGLAPA